MTSEIPSKIVLHVGAHKTASTHLQKSIEAALPLDGVTFAGPQKLRGAGNSIPELFGVPFDPRAAQVSELSPRDALIALADGADRLVLSEENFAGRIPRKGRTLYFTGPKRVARFAAIIRDAGGPPIDLCLGMRNPTDYLASVFSQTSKGKREMPVETFLKQNVYTNINWADYVGRLRACNGIGTVTVWRQEDYADCFAQICEAMVGTSGFPPLEGRINVRLSEQAVDTIAMTRGLTDADFRREVARTLPVTADNPPYDPYDAQAHAASQDFYAEQCAAIAAMPDVTFLQN